MNQPKAPPGEGGAYDRGHEAGLVAGQVDARLAGHDHHFADINGQLVKLTTGITDQTAVISKLAMLVQHLADQADSAAATAVALAAALKAAEEKRWGPWQRLGAVIAMIAAATAAAIGIRALFR